VTGLGSTVRQHVGRSVGKPGIAVDGLWMIWGEPLNKALLPA
jgi:hypothetical protein